MKIFIKSKSGDYIVTTAIGKKSKSEWIKYTKNNWINYCKKNNIGLIVFFDSLIDEKNIYWKKANWHKLLIGDYLRKKK